MAAPLPIRWRTFATLDEAPDRLQTNRSAAPCRHGAAIKQQLAEANAPAYAKISDVSQARSELTRERLQKIVDLTRAAVAAKSRNTTTLPRSSMAVEPGGFRMPAILFNWRTRRPCAWRWSVLPPVP